MNTPSLASCASEPWYFSGLLVSTLKRAARAREYGASACRARRVHAFWPLRHKRRLQGAPSPLFCVQSDLVCADAPILRAPFSRVVPTPPKRVRPLAQVNMALRVAHKKVKIGGCVGGGFLANISLALRSPAVHHIRAFSSGGERFPDTEEVTSSKGSPGGLFLPEASCRAGIAEKRRPLYRLGKGRGEKCRPLYRFYQGCGEKYAPLYQLAYETLPHGGTAAWFSRHCVRGVGTSDRFSRQPDGPAGTEDAIPRRRAAAAGTEGAIL